MPTDAPAEAEAATPAPELTNYQRLAIHLPEGSLARALLDAWVTGKPGDLATAAINYRESENVEGPTK
jgi:hypothetical protein